MIIPVEDNKILKYNQDKKSLKTPFFIHAATEFMFEKKPTHNANAEGPSQQKEEKKRRVTECIFTLLIR